MPQCFHAPTHPIASVPLFALNAIALLALDAIETRLPGAGRVAHLSLSARLAAGAHTLAAAALSPDSPSASHSGGEPAPAASGKMRRLPRHAASRVASPRQEAGRRCAMLCTGGKHAVARRLAQRPAASLLRVEGGLREGAGQAQVRGLTDQVSTQGRAKVACPCYVTQVLHDAHRLTEEQSRSEGYRAVLELLCFGCSRSPFDLSFDLSCFPAGSLARGY